MADFRINCIRTLRNSCDELSKLSQQISEMLLKSVQLRYEAKIKAESKRLSDDFVTTQQQMDVTKKLHMHKLRPNLSNPCV